MALARDTALVNNDILLETAFYEGSLLVDPHEILRVEFWKGDPAHDTSAIVEVISTSTGLQTSTGIYRKSLGIYTYIINKNSVLAPGLYFDKVFFVPVLGAEEEYVIGKVIVNKIAGVSSMGVPLCRLYGTVTDISGEPISGIQVSLNKADISETFQGNLVVFKPKKTITNHAGYFSIYAVIGQKLTLSIPAIGYRRVFILDGTEKNKDISTLDSFLHAPVDNPGEVNNFLGASVLRASSTGYVLDFTNEQNTPVFDWGK